MAYIQQVVITAGSPCISICVESIVHMSAFMRFLQFQQETGSLERMSQSAGSIGVSILLCSDAMYTVSTVCRSAEGHTDVKLNWSEAAETFSDSHTGF